jgi:hypothetical protein
MDRHRWTSSVGVVLLGVGLVLAYTSQDTLGDERPTEAGIGLSTVEPLSYQAKDYRYLFIPLEASPPPGFELPDFDDTSFAIGSGPFGAGGGGGPDGIDCPLQQTVQTYWAVESRLLVRRFIEIPEGATSVRVMVSVDNDIVGVFFNGTPIAEHIPHSDCPILDEFRFDVPQSLVRPGRNLVAFHLLDRPPVPDQGNETFFETRVLAEMTTSQLAEVAANLRKTAEEQLPSVSVSALSISECELPTPGGARGRIAVDATVDATGQRAQVIVNAGPQRSTVSIENKLDGQTMSTATQMPESVQRGQVTVPLPGAEPRDQRALVNLNASQTILPQPRAIAQIVECFAAIDHIVQPVAPCRENVDVAESNCQRACTAQASAAGAFCTSEFITCAVVREMATKELGRCIRECVIAANELRRSCPP